MFQKRKREGRNRDGHVESVSRRGSLSLLTDWPFMMTEVREISVQLLRAGHVYVMACPLAVVCVCVCEAEWRWHACECDM